MKENITKSQYKKIKQKIESERKKINTSLSEKQKEAGNYSMGHVCIKGFDITIENPKGSYRMGTDKSGKEWKTLMHHDYGYFKHTLGKDGDAIDVFIGPHLESDKIFCVDQFLGGRFDETKVMLGFKDTESAKEGYLKNYQKDWKGLKKITEVSIDDFKKWLYDGHKQRKPFYQYYDVKHYYITEKQYQYIQNRLNEDNTIEFSQKNMVLKHQENGIIKLYHNTNKKNLDEILIYQEMQCDRKHVEGHGNMLFFTTNPNAWEKECKISIEVPVNEFGNGYYDFYFVNTQDVTVSKNISTNSYNFKIEKVDGLTHDEIISKIKKDDEYIWQYLTTDTHTGETCIYTGVGNWFYNKVYPFESEQINESGEVLTSMWEDGDYATDIFNEFVSNPNGKMSWRPLIQPSIYQKALTVFTKTGSLEDFPVKYVYGWMGTLMRNTMKLITTTQIAGHSVSGYPIEELDNSNVFQFVSQKYGLIFDDYKDSRTLIFKTNEETILNLLLENYSNSLSTEEKKILYNYGNVNEDGIHKYGDLKGQRALFLTQDEIDKYDYSQKLKQISDKYQLLVEIFNKYFNRNYSPNKAFVEDGELKICLEWSWFLDYIGYFDWAQLPDGSDAISDYGIEPILKILNEYTDNSTPEETLVIINRILDVYHQRGDLSSAFIEGGRSTLSQISNGTYLNEKRG